MNILLLIHIIDEFKSSFQIIYPFLRFFFLFLKLNNSILYCHLFKWCLLFVKSSFPHRIIFIIQSGTMSIGNSLVRVFRIEIFIDRVLGCQWILMQVRSTWYIEISCRLISDFLRFIDFWCSFPNEIEFLIIFIYFTWGIVSMVKELLFIWFLHTKILSR